jgi:glycosyltransferase involved in cell wall biosynthesis
LDDLPPSAQIRLLPWRNGFSSVRNDLRLGQAMHRHGASVAHFPANYGLAPIGLPTVITLHDAINILPWHDIIRGHRKDAKTIAAMTYLHLMTKRSLRRQPVVITVSNFSRDSILRHSALKPDRVHVVYQAHDRAFHVRDDNAAAELRARYQLRERVLVADAIKNPDCTLRAFRRIPADMRDKLSLVFFTRRVPPHAVQRAEAAGECLVLTQPSTQALASLLNLGWLFIYPSWYEGFGLPALESMACGTPVIASSRGSLPEIVGDGGVIVDAEDDAAIADVLVALYGDPERYRTLREHALARAARFSWTNTAHRTIEIYDEALRVSCQAPSGGHPRTATTSITSPRPYDGQS